MIDESGASLKNMNMVCSEGNNSRLSLVLSKSQGKNPRLAN